jgi:hypothetical protein
MNKGDLAIIIARMGVLNPTHLSLYGVTKKMWKMLSQLSKGTVNFLGTITKLLLLKSTGS